MRLGRMSAPDLDGAMAGLQDADRGGERRSCHSPAPGSRPSAAFPISVRRAGFGRRTGRSCSTISLPARKRAMKSWRRRFAMSDEFGDAKPGRGHRALASLYRAGKVPAVITQNIDNLHQASGIAPEHVVELHGNTTYALCLDCAQRYELAWVRAADGCRQRLRARLSGVRRLHQDRDHIVRAGDAGYRNAARRSAYAVMRSVSGDRLFARGLARSRISLDGQTQWRPADHHQPRSDRLRRHRRSRGAPRYRNGARRRSSRVRQSSDVHRL